MMFLYMNHANESYQTSIKNLKSDITSMRTKLSSISKPKQGIKKLISNFIIGDTQNYGSLSITLDSTGGGTTMGFIPSNEKVFSVDLTVKNNGDTPYVSLSAFANSSFVYTQISTNTSTGKFSSGINTPSFDGGIAIILPGKALSGSVDFFVPRDASVDTYYYKSLTWYL